MNAEIAKDEEIAKIHAEEELKQMIEGLDRTKKQKRDFYMAVIKNNLGWKVKDFKGMSFEEVEAKFKTIWKQMEDFIPMGSKEKGERIKRKGLNLEQESAKKQKTSEEIDREDLNQLWALVKETLNARPTTDEKEMELWVELKRLYELDVEDHLWTHTQHIMHAPVEWRLYDTCGVHLGRIVGNNMHKAFTLPVTEFPLPEELPTAKEDSCHCQKNFPLPKKIVATARRKENPLPGRSHCYQFHRYDGDECDKGIMPTKIELTLEQSQKGVSNDVLVSIEGVEELKRNVWIKGEKKEALHTLKVETGSIHMLSVFIKEAQRMNAQIAKDEEIAKIHAEEELKQMIEGLDMSNETIAKHLEEYEQAIAELTIGERIELISELVKYQDRWKVKDFKGMSFEEVEAKFKTIWKQMEDFIHMGSKEEGERIKRKGLNLEQESAKKQKTSEEVLEEVKSSDEVPEEKIKELIRRVPIEEIDREDLNQLWALVKETLSARPTTDEKEMELWVELKRLYESDVEDHLWTHTQHIMHAPIEWRLYDTCGVHLVMFKDLEIFMLVEKNYPLRKALALVMICYKLQVENYYQMGRIVGNKMHKAFTLPVTEFPLPEELPTAREDSCHCQKKREATARKIALLSMSRRNCQSKVAVTLNQRKSPPSFNPSFMFNATSYKKLIWHKELQGLLGLGFNQSSRVLIFRTWVAPISSESERCTSYGIGTSSTGCFDREAGDEVRHLRWLELIVIEIDLDDEDSFGVDAAMVIKEKHQVFTAASEDIRAARQKLMLLVTAAK
uniref:Uncharacterized protein n=1 Tax=Tanacetum cinerariifolium TaxID=118510 RepID=A0A6L2J9U6_TANCI|nr:hypothetical protein [Tanacetum cinerariifolium]